MLILLDKIISLVSMLAIAIVFVLKLILNNGWLTDYLVILLINNLRKRSIRLSVYISWPWSQKQYSQ